MVAADAARMSAAEPAITAVDAMVAGAAVVVAAASALESAAAAGGGVAGGCGGYWCWRHGHRVWCR